MQTTQRLRDQQVDTPILMLTAATPSMTGSRPERWSDDYLTKPFAFGELVARVHALARRVAGRRTTVLEVDDLRLDPIEDRAWRGDVELRPVCPGVPPLATLMRHRTQP